MSHNDFAGIRPVLNPQTIPRLTARSQNTALVVGVITQNCRSHAHTKIAEAGNWTKKLFDLLQHFIAAMDQNKN